MPLAARRTLAPLAVVTAAAFVFVLLLVLVRLQWSALESADHGAAARLNSLVAGHAAVVSIIKAVTWLGSGGVLWRLTGIAVVALAIRRRWRLAGGPSATVAAYHWVCTAGRQPPAAKRPSPQHVRTLRQCSI